MKGTTAILTGSVVTAAGGECSDFELLFFEHYQKVLRLLIRLTGNRAQAEELANEVFWRLSRQRGAWLLTGDVAPWLYRTTMNVGIDAVRAANNRQRFELVAASDPDPKQHDDSPLEDLMRREERERVQSVLSRMKPERAQLLLMRSCDWSYRDIADALGLSVGSVGTLLNRAENDFRKQYLAVVEKEEKK